MFLSSSHHLTLLVGSIRCPARITSVSATLASETWSIENVNPLYQRETGSWKLSIPPGAVMAGRFGAEGEGEDVLPPLPTGERLQLSEVFEGGIGVGGKVWRAAGALCRWQRSLSHEIQGSEVLELGAGTGVSGLYAGALGASRIVLTDGGGPEVISNLQGNAERNAALLRERGCTSVECAHYRFGEGELPGNGFDWILASDVTYSVHDVRGGLCGCVAELLAQGKAGRCIIAHEHRRSTMFDIDTILTNRPAARWDEDDVGLREFLAVASEYGLRVTPLVSEPGSRKQDGDMVIMTMDMSIIELSLPS